MCPLPTPISCAPYQLPFHVPLTNSHFMRPLPTPISCASYQLPFHVPLTNSHFMCLLPTPISCASYQLPFHVPLTNSHFMCLVPTPISCASYQLPFLVPLTNSHFIQKLLNKFSLLLTNRNWHLHLETQTDRQSKAQSGVHSGGYRGHLPPPPTPYPEIVYALQHSQSGRFACSYFLKPYLSPPP